MISEFPKNILFNLKKHKYTFNPIFIIGCGRSGTTILGKTLSNHPEIKYLNERRDIWHKAYPEFDIWKKGIINPKLFANKDDIIPSKHNTLRHLFFREQVLSSKSVLLEKLPVNNFRLEFLNHSFPNAKYIYLTRNGLEVSKSIEKKIVKKQWLTGNKFELLQKFANQNNMIFKKSLSNVEKGMLEWKMSMDQSNSFFQKIDHQKFIHLSYQDLINDAKKSFERIFNLLNLDFSNNLLIKTSSRIIRKNPSITHIEDETLKELGGNILLKTIDNTYSPI